MYGDTNHIKKDGTIRQNYKGYIGNCSEDISSDFINDIKAHNKWDESMIESRNNKIEQMVLEEWGM